MPFDPRIVAADDSYPDDEQLEMLGAQLLDDAARLSQIYPAPVAAVEPCEPMVAAKGSQEKNEFGSTSFVTRYLWLASAAGLLLGIGSTAIWYVRHEQVGVLAETATWQSSGGDPSEAAARLLTQPAWVATPVQAPGSNVSLPEITPAVAFPAESPGLTGPEWEAVLDLMESAAPAEQTVSL